MQRRKLLAIAAIPLIIIVAVIQWKSKMRDQSTEADRRRARSIQELAELCDHGSARACVGLGELYVQGSGPNAAGRDEALAARYFRKGCDGNDPDGCAGLSRLYWQGRGVAKDEKTAKQLLKRALNLSPRMVLKPEVDQP